MIVRDFRPDDVDALVDILRLNNQYGNPQVDGPEAMKKVGECESAVFLVCEVGGRVVGLVRGVYDGSRALIHQLSVRPDHKGLGIGTALVREIVRRFGERGAPTVSATVIDESLGFWQKVGFRKTKAFLVGNW